MNKRLERESINKDGAMGVSSGGGGAADPPKFLNDTLLAA